MALKNPLYALLFAPDHQLRTMIELGVVGTTIRQGWRDYKTGPVMLCCHEVPWAVMADIEEVRHTQVSQLDHLTKANAGLNAHPQEALKQLQKHYPTLELNSQVTVVYWTNVRGALVTRTRKSRGLRTD